jgi:hypothetical protein
MIIVTMRPQEQTPHVIHNGNGFKKNDSEKVGGDLELKSKSYLIDSPRDKLTYLE